MTEISRCDVIAAIGEADALMIREALRTKCSTREFRRALAFAGDSSNAGVAGYDDLPTRVQGLTDLLGVALDQARGDRQAHTAPMISGFDRHAA